MRFFLFFFILAVLGGCVRNNRLPKDVIPQNDMRKIMWDLMRADAYVSDYIMKDSSRNKIAESAILYEKIFTIHATTQESFKKSLAFYESRPDLLKVITDSLKSDEKKAQNYVDYKRPQQADTTRKIKATKKLIPGKQ
jgi:hypothetical protein